MLESRSALEQVLSNGALSEVVGTIENSWFDAKEQPYDTRTDAGKRSLARDVAAFANADGGVLMIGARTNASATHYGDEVTEIRAFAQTLVDTGQYMKVAGDWIYPNVEGLDVAWFADATDPRKGVIAVRVPPQRAELRPFLVVKTIDAGKVVESVSVTPNRRRDTNEPMRVADLQRALRAGLNFERTLDGRLSSIESTLQNFAHAPKPVDSGPAQRLEARIRSALDASDFADDRYLILTAYPTETAELKTIFASDVNSIRLKLERPPILRSGGWDLATQRPTEIIRGEMIRVRGFRKILDLYRDGTFVFGCVASDDFLAWTSPQQQLHPMGIVEIMYSFCAFYQLVLRDFETPPKNIQVRIHMANLHRASGF